MHSSDPHLGYADPLYAQVLGHHGVVTLPRTGASLLRRPLPPALPSALRAGHDLANPYPLWDAPRWTGLEEDLADLGREGAVSVVAVIEPLGAPSAEVLRTAFPDLCRPFKRHYLVRLDAGDPLRGLSEHHRRNVRRARSLATVERVAEPLSALDTWCELYDGLAASRAMSAASLLSREQFQAMLGLAGLTAYRAVSDGRTTGMALWLDRGDRAWFHLGATDDAGRRDRASYAIMAAALEDFAARGARWADLGGGSGLADDPANSLAVYKRGWCTDEVVALLVGRVLDPVAYERLAAAGHGDFDGYFPAYRAPHFVQRAGEAAR